MVTPTKKLLVVDDIKDWQITISGVLRDNGYSVSTAGSVNEAISLLNTSEYDLALLDLRLDETDEENKEGLELARIIRTRWPEVKIVVFTGYGTQEILQNAMEPGPDGKRLVDDYLSKEETNKVISTVQRLTEKK